MAEPSKGKSSSADQKKKKSSFLDEEIDDDFLSSWKSTSVMKDDGMDFSFNTGAISKKKVFDFDKLDMDFNLDGDFNKISSFKMDMSDFDFSSPPKKDAKTKEVDMSDLDLSSPPKKAAKTKAVDMSDLDLSSPPKKAAKTKERSEEEPSRGSRQGKQDHFKFSFDFNELDSFDLDSTLSRREKSSKNEDGIKEVISDGAGREGSEVDLAEGISTLDGESETVATSKIDPVLVDQGNTISMKDCASKTESSGNFELPPDPRCQENITYNSKEVSNQESHLPEKVVSIEPYAEQTIHDLPTELVSGVDSNADAGVDRTNGGCPQIKKVNTISGGKEAANDKMLVEDGANNEELPFKRSSPLDIGRLGSSNGDRSMSDCDTLIGNAEPAKGDLDNGETLATVVSRKTPHDINSIKGTENSNLKLPLSTQASKSTVEKVALRKESGAGAFCSKISKRLEDTGPHLRQSSLIGANSLSSGNNKVGSMYLSPAIEKRVTVNANDAQHGSKLLTTRVLVDKETKVRPAIPGRESSDSDGKANETKLVGDPQQCDKEVTETEPFVGSEQRQNIKDLRIQVSSSSSTDKTRIMLPSVEPLRNSKIITAEVKKHCPDKTAQKKSDISSWNIGGNKHSLIAAPQKEVKTQRSSDQNKKPHHNVEMETRQIVDGREKMPQILPLKRKAFEGLSPGLASLKPLKRLSLSPRETRNSTEPSKGTVEQVCLHENHSEIKTKSSSCRLGSMVNVMELELPSAMETDENVEKAEAYTKELEDICNMLKKKHEEAKELLVRAVVNNNNLLMLNHPIYEAKIHKVQKFAAKLASKELQVC
uniref:uncharacterized protein At4g18490 isoform X1 n=1 Tax=Fragaria vesca subsp. vesca TaxID=101020 RepID=UPI0005C8E3A3|nr:PREDICTED: uncharacterized protein At4g18490 isoform X1 [Fragaria vesca subsp. vesca]